MLPEAAATHRRTHGDHHPALAHHFDNLDQQQEAATLGMWVFLVTEVMFFGGLFAAYSSIAAGIRTRSRRRATRSTSRSARSTRPSSSPAA